MEPVNDLGSRRRVSDQATAIAVREATELSTLCSGLEYGTTADREQANRALREIKRMSAVLDEREEEITKPIRAGLNSARELFRQPRAALARAEREVKAGILAGLQEDEALHQRAAQLAIDAGDTEAAIAIAEASPIAPDGFQIRRTSRAEVTNAAVVPARYLNDERVKKAIAQVVVTELRQGATIPGVQLVFSSSVASRG